MASRRPSPINAAILGKAVVMQCQDDLTALWSPADNGPSFKCICVISLIKYVYVVFYIACDNCEHYLLFIGDTACQQQLSKGSNTREECSTVVNKLNI